MINVEEIINLTPRERNSLIEQDIEVAPDNIDENLKETYEYSRIINTFIDDYIRTHAKKDQERKEGTVLSNENLTKEVNKELTVFKPLAIAELQNSIPSEDELISKGKNLYELSGARKLAFGNNATRNLSTTMGLLWERIANISPFAISPEREFDIKLTGIDIILLNRSTDVIEYAQFKTQQNTLTGSQKPRAVKELSIHDHPIFCACFETKSNWTFRDDNISRYVGAEVWSRIGIDYDIILSSVKNLIKELEDEYVSLLTKM